MTKKVILIEPDKRHSDIYMSLLKKLDVNVVHLKYDFSARIYLQQDKPDLVIIGCCIPNQNTVEFIQFIKNNKNFSNTRLFKFCPCKSHDYGRALVSAGADDYVCLPELNAQTLEYKLQCLLYANEEVIKVKEMRGNASCDLNHVENIDAVNNQETKAVKNKAKLEELKMLVTKEDLEKKLRKASFAKAIPHIVHELLYLTSSVNSNLKELIHLIELDPGLTARVLKCANSSYYRGNNKRIYNLTEAVKTMGFNGLKDLVMGIGILDSFNSENRQNGLDRIKLWYHSITTGVIARDIAAAIDYEKPDSLFVTGVLHDIGTALFDEHFAKEYEQVLQVTIENEHPLEKVETRMLGINHCDISQLVLKAWGFPENILQPICNHHKPFSQLVSIKNKFKTEIIITKLAEALTKVIGAGLFNFDAIDEIPKEVIQYLDIKPEKLVEIIENSKDNTFELLQIMLLHMNPADLQKCDDFNGHKSFNNEKVLLFNTDANSFSAYEILLKQLNYNVKTYNNVFTLPDCSSFDALILHFADPENLSSDIALLRKIQKTYGKKSPDLCIIATDDVVENMKTYKDLNLEIMYLIKPVSLKMVMESIEKVFASDSSMKKSG